jgi:hypothetical protein
MSKKIQVTFENWQYEKVVSRAAKYEMNVSSYVRYCVLEHEYFYKSLNERTEQVSGLKELLITHGIVIPRELRG